MLQWLKKIYSNLLEKTEAIAVRFRINMQDDLIEEFKEAFNDPNRWHIAYDCEHEECEYCCEKHSG